MDGVERQPLDIGALVDRRFEITSLLGQGGFGIVFKARQLSTGQPVAIKVLHPKRVKDKAKQQAARRAVPTRGEADWGAESSQHRGLESRQKPSSNSSSYLPPRAPMNARPARIFTAIFLVLLAGCSSARTISASRFRGTEPRRVGNSVRRHHQVSSFGGSRSCLHPASRAPDEDGFSAIEVSRLVACRNAASHVVEATAQRSRVSATNCWQ